MQNKRLFIPPVVANVTTTTVLIDTTITAVTGPTGFTATQPYILLHHIRAVNTSNSTPYTVTMFYGTANTQVFAWSAVAVPASSYVDWFGEIRIDGGLTKLYGGASNAAIWFNFDDAEIGFQ